MPELSGDDRVLVHNIVDQYRFDPVMSGGYSSFETIEDPEFHRLLREFREARQRLAAYVGVKVR